jgi:hypothetical protein
LSLSLFTDHDEPARGRQAGRNAPYVDGWSSFSWARIAASGRETVLTSRATGVAVASGSAVAHVALPHCAESGRGWPFARRPASGTVVHATVEPLLSPTVSSRQWHPAGIGPYLNGVPA